MYTSKKVSKNARKPTERLEFCACYFSETENRDFTIQRRFDALFIKKIHGELDFVTNRFERLVAIFVVAFLAMGRGLGMGVESGRGEGRGVGGVGLSGARG